METPGDRYDILTVLDSVLKPSGDYALAVAFCNSQMDIYIKGSTFIAGKHGTSLRILFSSMNFTATENIFSETARALDVDFCYYVELQRKHSKSIRIT